MEGSREKTVVDALSTALKAEMAGHVFYKRAAEIVTDEMGKGVFRHLADEELQHIEAVKAVVESLNKGEGWMSYEEALKAGSPYGQKEASLKFPEENELIEKLATDQSDQKAVSIAIENEENAVEFYGGLLKEAELPAEKVFLTKLLEMEKEHLKVLRWEYESLLKTGFWGDFMEYSVEKETE